MWLILQSVSVWQQKQIDIVRQTLPALKDTALKDFIDILDRLGLYNENNYNKTDRDYQLHGNTISFRSLDQPQKKRGRKRNILFLNEANELDLESWRQLEMRTTEKIIIDYNPSMDDHWIYDDVLIRDKKQVDFYKSTYLDNPFLEQSIVDSIERYKQVDENYWKIYGLGERGQIKGLVFPNIQQVNSIPEGCDVLYGLDWGYTNDPSAVIRVAIKDFDIYLDEVVYRKGMTNFDLARLMKANGINETDEVICDSAEPKSIDELYVHGFNVKPCKKGPDSIVNGISLMKQYRLYVTKNSLNVLKELRNYKWIEDKNGKFLNKPVDAFNHAIDAIRYAITHRKGLTKRKEFIVL